MIIQFKQAFEQKQLRWTQFISHEIIWKYYSFGRECSEKKCVRITTSQVKKLCTMAFFKWEKLKLLKLSSQKNKKFYFKQLLNAFRPIFCHHQQHVREIKKYNCIKRRVCFCSAMFSAIDEEKQTLLSISCIELCGATTESLGFLDVFWLPFTIQAYWKSMLYVK